MLRQCGLCILVGCFPRTWCRWFAVPILRPILWRWTLGRCRQTGFRGMFVGVARLCRDLRCGAQDGVLGVNAFAFAPSSMRLLLWTVVSAAWWILPPSAKREGFRNVVQTPVHSTKKGGYVPHSAARRVTDRFESRHTLRGCPAWSFGCWRERAKEGEPDQLYLNLEYHSAEKDHLSRLGITGVMPRCHTSRIASRKKIGAFLACCLSLWFESRSLCTPSGSRGEASSKV